MSDSKEQMQSGAEVVVDIPKFLTMELLSRIAGLEAENQRLQAEVEVRRCSELALEARVMSLAAELEQHRWISVDERLPEDYAPCLCYCGSAEEPQDRIQIGFVEGGVWRMHARYGSFQFDGTTHWQPIVVPEVSGE